MHLVINHAGQEIATCSINFLFDIAGRTDFRRHFFNPPMTNQHIALLNLAFVDHAGITNQDRHGHTLL